MARRAVLAACVCLVASQSSAADEPSMPAETAFAAAQGGRLVVIDIRSPDEWRETGSPRGAARISIEQSFDDQDFVDQVFYRVGRDRAASVALICSGGERSRRGTRLLTAAGFADVRWIREGVRALPGRPPGWIERGLPVDP